MTAHGARFILVNSILEIQTNLTEILSSGVEWSGTRGLI